MAICWCDHLHGTITYLPPLSVLHLPWHKPICWSWTTDPQSQMSCAQQLQVNEIILHFPKCLTWNNRVLFVFPPTQTNPHCWENNCIWEVPYSPHQSTGEALCIDLICTHWVAAGSVGTPQAMDPSFLQHYTVCFWFHISGWTFVNFELWTLNSNRGCKFTKKNAFIGYQKDTPAAVVFQATKRLVGKESGTSRRWESIVYSGQITPARLMEEKEGSELWQKAVGYSFGSNSYTWVTTSVMSCIRCWSWASIYCSKLPPQLPSFD